LAARPYDRVDLAQRGRPPDAGHGVGRTASEVLHHIYAKVIVGQEDAARRRIDAVLGGY
jgi:hypothetical protein